MTETEEMEAILDVFTTDGWKLILQDIEKTYQSLDSVRDIQSIEGFWETKGKVTQLLWMMHLEEWYRFSEQNAEI